MLASAVDISSPEAAGGLCNGSHPTKEHAPVVLDLRNGYEWDAGHFDGAARPQEEEFRETPRPVDNGARAYDDSDDTSAEFSDHGGLPAYLQGRALDTPIMVRVGRY
jgi:rhodanese-related sulfurtransferase